MDTLLHKRSGLTLAFSCGARSASELSEISYLRNMLPRRQLQGLLCFVDGGVFVRYLGIPKIIQLSPPFGSLRLQILNELIRVNSGISRDILNPLERADRRSIFHIRIAFEMQFLDYVENGRKFLDAMSPLQFHQVMRELSQINVEQLFILVESPMFFPLI
jgi:hypothetical protein